LWQSSSVKELPLSQRIHTDPVYRDTIKEVGYLGISLPVRQEFYDAMKAYGQERIIEASEALVDIDTDRKFATLKAEVRRLCLAILGPAPENWDTFYEGVTNPPPNPYKKPASQKTSEEMIRELDDAALQALLEDARIGLNHHGPKSRKGRGFKKDIAMAEAEIARRAKPIPDQPEADIDLVADAIADAIRDETGMHVEVRTPDALEALQLEVLEGQLHKARMRCLTSKTTKAQNRANQDVQRLLAEYERRKTVPPPERVKDLPTPPKNEPKPQEFDVVGFRDFQKATDHRLKELFDMLQYELTRNDFDSVTYKEAIRDIGLIEAELRRRKERVED
jgi:hypothetical protein